MHFVYLVLTIVLIYGRAFISLNKNCSYNSHNNRVELIGGCGNQKTLEC